MFLCQCLNVKIIVEKGEARPLAKTQNGLRINVMPALSDVACFESLEFLKSALGPVTEASVSIQHDALVSTTRVDKWTINHCLNCDSYCFATAGDGALLVNGNLACDEAQLNSLMKCDKYSMPFKIILKPIDVLPRALHVSINDDARVKSLYGKLQEYIVRDSSETEAEIRRLTKEMNGRRQQAEMDFQRIVTLIESSNSSTASTKSLSSEDIESLTPPVTPESINEKMMNIDDHLPQRINKSVAFAKHTNAIHQQHITRNINFDDDIFELDGMQDEPKNDQDRYHKYSDTDEGSDGEKMMIEKRAMNRGRSGSINFARSAPISMPLFNHHAIHAIDTDDKAVNDQQMDIASSIKMLARSIHADSVFGELPGHARSVRYNTEF